MSHVGEQGLEPAQLEGCEYCLLLWTVFIASARAALALVPFSRAV